jgi:hypothetical protein
MGTRNKPINFGKVNTIVNQSEIDLNNSQSSFSDKF